jgi:hypothetical protein
LIFEDLTPKSRVLTGPTKIVTDITFSYPDGKKRIEGKEITLPSYGDKVKISIYESPTPLDSPRNNSFGLAGILIKTEGAILDNQLFRFENEPAHSIFLEKQYVKD